MLLLFCVHLRIYLNILCVCRRHRFAERSSTSAARVSKRSRRAEEYDEDEDEGEMDEDGDGDEEGGGDEDDYEDDEEND
jgi:hypothetical protein